MGESLLLVLAIAASAVFGGVGVLVGLAMGVRTIQRDEERFGPVSLQLESVQADLAQMKLEWGRTLENLEELAVTVDRRRRRAAASESAVNRRDQANQEPQIPLTVQEQRDEIRRRMRRVV